jgi:hypothetical protein
MAQAVSRLPFTEPGSVHVGFVVDKVALENVFPRVLRFPPVSFIPPVLHYNEKRRKLIIFITGLHNKPQSCGASVASAARPFTKKKFMKNNNSFQFSSLILMCWYNSRKANYSDITGT